MLSLYDNCSVYEAGADTDNVPPNQKPNQINQIKGHQQHNKGLPYLNSFPWGLTSATMVVAEMRPLASKSPAHLALPGFVFSEIKPMVHLLWDHHEGT